MLASNSEASIRQLTPDRGLVLQLHLCCRYGPLLGECGRGGASMSVAVWSGSLVAWERDGMTKTAQLAVSRGLAETVAGTGVTVNAVLPGPTLSEGVADFLGKMGSGGSSD